MNVDQNRLHARFVIQVAVEAHQHRCQAHEAVQVAILHSFVGLAAVLVGFNSYLYHEPGMEPILVNSLEEILPRSLPNATIEPVKVTAPMKIPRNTSVR
jgi:NAD/NADP transhydrogenase beta subunit